MNGDPEHPTARTPEAGGAPRRASAASVLLALVIAVSLSLVFFAVTATATSDPAVRPYAVSLAVGLAVVLLLLGLVDVDRAAKGIFASALSVLPNMHGWAARSAGRSLILGGGFLLAAGLSLWAGPWGVTSQTVQCGDARKVEFSVRPGRLACDGALSRDIWLTPFERGAEVALDCFDAASNRWSGVYHAGATSQCGARPQDAAYVANGIALPPHDPQTVAGQRMAEGHARLRAALSGDALPDRRVKDRLLFATWNIRDLGRQSAGRDRRMDEAYVFLAEVLSHFDIIAVQELKDPAGLDRLLALLGEDYRAEFSFEAPGPGGNRERLGFIYDTRKVSFGDVSTTIVFEMGDNLGSDTGQPARPPFLAEFIMNGRSFFVVTAHAFFGKSSGPKFERRLAELRQMAAGIDRTFGRNFPDHPVILAGDLNVSSARGPEMEALLSNGFDAPAELRALPSNIADTRPYDQILLRGATAAKMPVGRYGVVRATDYVFRTQDFEAYGIDMQKRVDRPFSDKAAARRFYRMFRSFQISDHHLKWAEFQIDW